MIQPVGPTKGPKYAEPGDDVMDGSMVEQIYNFTVVVRDEYVNPLMVL